MSDADRVLSVRRRPGFFIVENAAVSIITEIGRTAFCLYCVLLRYANQQGECFPTVKRLASDIGCSVRTVQYELRKLEEAGYLKVTEVIDAPSIYHVHDPSERERQSSAANDNNNSCMSEIAPPGANDCTPVVQPIAPPTVTSPSSPLLSPLPSPSVPSPAPPSLTPPSYPPIIPPPSPPMRFEQDPTNIPPPSPPRWGGVGGAREICANEPALTALDGFDRFWQAYPRKVGKLAALKIWQRLSPTEHTIEIMLTALQWQKETEQWKKDNGQFIPHPSTWLNQGRWLDEQPRRKTFREAVDEIAARLVAKGLCSE